MLTVSKLSKTYGGKVPYQALTDIDLSIRTGEFVGIMGPSGSGKTTLLNLVATIDTPTSGEVLLNGENPHHLKRSKLALFRRRHLGFVFQDFNLLNTLTIKENIVLPLTLDKKPLGEMEQKVMHVAKKLDIVKILDKRTYEVSGGQMQRAAIARAIIHQPSLLLADEPTGNLDSKSSRDVMETMETINTKDGTTMMMVTHDPQAASYCHRVLFIKDGQLYNEIHRGENRQTFFQQIVDVLSLLGGNDHDLSSAGI
ncbi:ABC transporter ATP-binding protein [Melghirimyces algeriensis]|uniref:Putative ABC transport system ATP-binding protein n=1 Tax=Melghirimyces algeriensis TaxID=910412 RepID=A0A521ENI7_9BACL|nr:ABC transporter ATP-binding protein [Melghirimyces algeriensis]SMO85478.1 putative ABC transport system ATP-binding protein [Melghirimyces algeriensis]